MRLLPILLVILFIADESEPEIPFKYFCQERICDWTKTMFCLCEGPYHYTERLPGVGLACRCKPPLNTNSR